MPEIYIIVSLIGAVIGLVIMFYIIRGAVISALREVLERYLTPQKMLTELEKLNARTAAPEAEEKSAEQQATADKAVIKTANLIKGNDGHIKVCSLCGAKYGRHHTVCFDCNAKVNE